MTHRLNLLQEKKTFRISLLRLKTSLATTSNNGRLILHEMQEISKRKVNKIKKEHQPVEMLIFQEEMDRKVMEEDKVPLKTKKKHTKVSIKTKSGTWWPIRNLSKLIRIMRLEPKWFQKLFRTSKISSNKLNHWSPANELFWSENNLSLILDFK